MALNTRITPARLLIKYNGLIKELHDNSENCSWTLHEMAEYQDRWLHLQAQVEKYCESVSAERADLQIYQNTVSFCDHFEKVIDGHAHLSEIDVDMSVERQEDLQATLIGSFDENFNETPAFFYKGDDDNDDDDDE